MVEYKCFKCGKGLTDDDIKKKLRCPYCGDRIFFKPRQTPARVLAR